MSRYKRFHNLIEQENAEEKERVWANIRKVDTFTLVEEREKERIFRKFNWLSVIVSSLLLIVITIFCNVNNPSIDNLFCLFEIEMNLFNNFFSQI